MVVGAGDVAVVAEAFAAAAARAGDVVLPQPHDAVNLFCMHRIIFIRSVGCCNRNFHFLAACASRICVV